VTYYIKGEKMKSKIEFLIVFWLVIIISSPVTASAREITVDDNYGADFVSIQEAVNNSVPGDKIIVRPGTYTENVLVNVNGLTIRSEASNGDALVKPLNESVSTFMITADNITISGLNIIGPSQDYEKSAIFIYGDMNNITGNTIENGCILLGPERGHSLITENKISNSKSEEGIHISCCGFDTNVVLNNTISNCSIGIYEYDQAADIRNNRITDCDSGIELAMASSKIDNNTILKCNVGIKLGDACPVEIINNTILSCSDCGIFDTERYESKRICNNCFNNSLNVKFGPGEGGNTWNNSLTRGTNIVGGPYIGGNFWAKPDGTGFSQTSMDLDGNGIGDFPYNIYEDEFDYLPLVLRNSYLPLANFYANPSSGNAPLLVQFTDNSEKVTKWNWDFGDGANSSEQNPMHNYSAAGNFTVNLTVSNENGTDSKSQQITVRDPKDLPVANLSTNVTSGYAPLAVQFTDLSENSIGRSWDFNNDWQGDSGDAATVYVFTEPGSYNVNLVAINENGTAIKTTTITVLEESSSGGNSGGSHSSSGSGGAGGGSPEPAKNVKGKELCQVFIASGKAVKFDFTKNITSIISLNFDSKKTVGKTAAIVEMLKNKSTLTKETPENEVYNYLNIWVGNGGYGSDEDNLENAVINFKVEKSWVHDKGIDKSSITINRYNDKKWNALSTTLLSEDDKYLYFTTQTPGFSPFAITGKVVFSGKVNEIQPQTVTKSIEQNNISNVTNVEHTQSTNNSEKGSTKTPGFEMFTGIISLFVVILYKTSKKSD
jgi:PGF-pre-PGF domain-containing protein